MRSLLILGGSGFISGTLARVAMSHGVAVTIVTRGRRALPPNVTAIVADRDASDFVEIVRPHAEVDLVVDCIGFRAEHAIQDLALASGVARHLVFVSTDSCMDPTNRPWTIDESFDRFETQSPYGRGKREAEVALLAGEALGTAVTILRPCHLYGPGSQLGCIPTHGRDVQLIDRIRRGEPLRLLGGGHFLQQPIAACDFAEMALSCLDNRQADREIFLAAGPDVVASRDYYRIIADALGVAMPPIEEVPIDPFLAGNPTLRHFACHRVYPMTKARAAGLAVPATRLATGLAEHVRSMTMVA